MEQYGNPSTYNLESVLKQNVVNSDFYRNDCAKLSSWSQVIDEIYYQVDYVEPWLAGNARGPSTAFCLLHRLFTIKPTEEEIRATINHEDSVYIRAVGFLYLRYVCDPRTLWNWMAPYCDDKEEIQPSGPNGPAVTMGDFVRDLLLEQYYYETIFPRIPKKVEDDIQTGLRARGLPTKGKGNGGCGGPDRRGGDDGNRRPASVKASLSVAFGQRAPNRAGTKGWKGDGAAAGSREDRGDRGDKAAVPRSRSRSRSRDRARDYGRSRNGRDYDRERPRERDHDSGRGYDRERGYDSRGHGRGERPRDYDSGRGYDRERDDHERGYDSRGSGRGGYDSRDRERGGDRYRSSRSRSRSRDRQRAGGRDASDVFKERAVTDGSAAAADIRSRYGDASGKLEFGSSGSGRRTDEVFRIGGRGYR